MRVIIAAALLATSSVTFAQSPDSARKNAERALFEKIVEIPTVRGRTAEFGKLTALLKSEFAKAGITNVIVKDHDGTQTMIARWPAAKPSGKKPILLMAHMDVVEAKASDWKNPPFEFREADRWYLGRGTNDNKAALTGAVLALQELRRQRFEPTRDIIVLFTGDEETTGNGARRAVGEWRDLVDAEYAINFDGGGGALYADGRVDAFLIEVAEKTYADYKLVATNRGGHSASPRPDNAIYALAGALKAIEAHRFQPMVNEATKAQFKRLADKDQGRLGELVKLWLADPTHRERADLVEAFLPGYTRTRCVATMVAGGHAPNALPQRAEATVNCRIFPEIRIDAVRQQLQSLAGPDVTVTTVEGSTTPETDPSPLRPEVVDAYAEALRGRFTDAQVTPFMSSSATDGSYVRAGGIPVYGLSGTWGIIGQPGGAHGLDERVLIDAFHGQVPIVVNLLRRLAG